LLCLIDKQQTLVKFSKILRKVMKYRNYCNKNGWLTSAKPRDDPSAGPKNVAQQNSVVQSFIQIHISICGTICKELL